jgi:formate dehydrogenase maturation protein FdhE
MPSLAEAARRLAGPAPAGLDKDAYAVLHAVWQTFPRAATGWRSVLSADQPTPERWAGLKEGAPLLDESMVQWDAAPLRQQHGRLLRLFRAPAFSRLEALADLQRLMTTDSCEPARWARLFFQAEVNDPRPEVLLGGYIIQPFLYMYARRALPGLHQEDWRSSRCPVCGGRPYHGYLHPQSRRKILVCGKCQCPWTAPRLQCPFCENTLQDSLGYFYQEQAPDTRVDYCTACRSILPITQYPESGCPFPLNDHLTSMPLQSAVGRRQNED